jgi:hypothetical protein
VNPSQGLFAWEKISKGLFRGFTGVNVYFHYQNAFYTELPNVIDLKGYNRHMQDACACSCG